MVFNITKIIRKYIPTVFIAIVQEDNVWIINSKVIKNGILKNKFSKSFDIIEEDILPQGMLEYLEKIQTDYNFAYVSLFLDSMGQGAICGNTTSDFEKNSVDIKNVTHFDIDGKWSVYASFIDINWIKKLFSDVGIDFIYSPFMVQNFLLKKEKRKIEPTLYILNHHDCVTISIFEDVNLVFGAFFRTTSDEKLINSDDMDYWDTEPEEKGLDNIIELDGMEEEEFSSFDGLEEIEDLDTQADSGDFLEISIGDKDLGHFDEQESQDNIELFGRDVLVYKYLTSSLKEYYRNNLYRSDFIDKIVLFDGYEVSSDLIEMLENDLFMDVELHKINIHDVICEMSMSEAMQ